MCSLSVVYNYAFLFLRISNSKFKILFGLCASRALVDFAVKKKKTFEVRKKPQRLLVTTFLTGRAFGTLSY